jgi:hypothetical protein
MARDFEKGYGDSFDLLKCLGQIIGSTIVIMNERGK